MKPKFRAFLKDTNQIVDVAMIFFEIGIVKLTNNEFYQFEDIILMQSTTKEILTESACGDCD